MPKNHLDYFLHQTQIAGHISGRDVGKRVAVTALMVGVCFVAEMGPPALMVGFSIMLLELLVYPLNRRASRFDEPINFLMACGVFTFNLTSMVPFLGFGVILSQSNALPFILIGYIWTFGVFVHVSNTFGLLPLYNWSQMTTAFGAVFLMLWLQATNPEFSYPMESWGLTAAMLVVYIVNTFDTMNRQKDTHRALNTARAEANTRLTELERLSHSDSLTGLMNRRAFDEIVQRLLRTHTNKLGLTIFLLDLDGFKPINDTYGHQAGDAVLGAVSERLKKFTSRGGQVARLGGDEFGLALPTITSEQEALDLATEMQQALAQPVMFAQKKLTIGASIGIARQGVGTDTPNALLSAADQAMFVAKQDPEARPVVYDKSAFPARATLEDRQVILDALRLAEIQPFYQPKVDLTTGTIIGFEALSRWQHPERGLLPPSEFLPLINELGLEGEFMVHTAAHVLRHLDCWVRDGLNPGEVSINIAEVTLATHSGRDELFELIDRYPHLRQHLTFEITEDIFIARSAEFIRESIQRFRRAGVRISLDDFGTGFASMQHLKELEFDELKLDTGFVCDLGVDPAAHVLIEGLITISRGLGVDLVAEGVESTRQRDLLRDMGCTKVQGYFYGVALPHNETQMRLLSQGMTSSATQAFRRNFA